MSPKTALVLLFLIMPRAADAREGETAYFAAEEKFLEAFALDASGNSISLLDDLEGSSMMFKVKDPSGKTVAVFKPTSGNTLHAAEIAAYRLCRRLGLPVCAPTVEKTAGPETLRRFAELLRAAAFEPKDGDRHAGHFVLKERFRRAMLARLEEMDSLPGAFKSWISPLVLYQPLGTVADVKTHELYPYLFHDGPSDGGKPIELRQCTRIYNPPGCYRAELAARDLLEQFTGMLAVDALIGDNDRFAGGNVHLFSIDARLETEDGRHRLPFPSLLMLDNGAGFMSDPHGALRLITRDLKITRFPRSLYDGIAALHADYERDTDGVLGALGIPDTVRHAGKTFRPARVFDKNLNDLLDYMRELEKKYGYSAFY